MSEKSLTLENNDGTDVSSSAIRHGVYVSQALVEMSGVDRDHNRCQLLQISHFQSQSAYSPGFFLCSESD
jgi:hypothetical protein